MDLAIIEALSRPAYDRGSDCWQAALHEQLQTLGFAHFHLRLSSGTNTLDIASFGKDAASMFSRHLSSQDHSEDTHGANSILPVMWTRPVHTIERKKNINGMTFTLLGPQGQHGTLDVSFGCDCEIQAAETFRASLPMLSLIKDCVLQGALVFLQAQGTIKLTKREKEVLRWSAIGKTNWEISNICNRSEACIDFHFKNIRRKFGVSTRRAAAVQALAMHIIKV